MPIPAILRQQFSQLYAEFSASLLVTEPSADGGQIALLIERFDGAELSGQADEAARQAALRQLADDLSDNLSVDDMVRFAHWLYTAKGWRTSPHYLKVAPGENAEDWDNCLARGDIGIAWKRLGDLTGLNHQRFDERLAQAQEEDPDNNRGAGEVWPLANAKIGDYVLANRGFKELLGIGVITGDYVYAPDQIYCHRRPVQWFNVTPREMDKHWVRTIIKMTRSTFEELISGAPLKPSKTKTMETTNAREQLASPLDAVFSGRAEADWALDLMRETVALLELASPDDERLVVTYTPAQHALKLHYGQVNLLKFWQTPDGLAARLALLDGYGSQIGLHSSYTFAITTPSVSLYPVEATQLPAFIEQRRAAYHSAVIVTRDSMRNHVKSGFRRFHVPELGAALFSDQARAQLYAQGFAPRGEDEEEDVPLPANGYFTARTFELLRMLDDDPRYAIYKEHEAEFQSQLIEPFKELMADIAALLPVEWQALLETQKRLTSNIAKNDYGRGGAWPFYWGAFYLKGIKRTSSAQLYVELFPKLLDMGFSIGSRDSQEPTSLFWENLDGLPLDLSEALKQLLDEEAGLVYPGIDQPTFSSKKWIAQGATPNISMEIQEADVLSFSKDELRARLLVVWRRLWPLFLLATMEDPIPMMREYLGVFSLADPPNPVVTVAEVAARLSLPENTIAAWLAGLERKGQAILYGPPGTGKTFAAHALADHLIGGGYGRVELVQFHPAYAYEDFIEGLRPVKGLDGQLTYRVRRGLLLEFCDQARQRPDDTFVLIIDEINRANLSRVFGELMYLLEYRQKQVRLAVSSELFGIPPNVRLIGTMNTADRSIALVDHALRRRFAFIRLAPEWGIVRRHFAQGGLAGVDLDALITQVNRLNEDIELDYRVGITFFLRQNLGRHLESIWRMEIEPYLEEYFFDQPAKLKHFGWDQIAKLVLPGAADGD